MNSSQNQHFEKEKTFKLKGAQGLNVKAIFQEDGTATVHYHNISEPIKEGEDWKKEEDIKFEGTYKIIEKKQDGIFISIEISKYTNMYKCTDFVFPDKSEERNDTIPLKVTIDLTHTITDEFAVLSQNLLMYL